MTDLIKVLRTPSGKFAFFNIFWWQADGEGLAMPFNSALSSFDVTDPLLAMCLTLLSSPHRPLCPLGLEFREKT